MQDAGYCRIPLKRRDGTVRGYAIFDQSDAALGQYPWYLLGGYVGRAVPRPDGGQTAELMHRVILGLAPGDGLEGDHINLDKLDNRRSNLGVDILDSPSVT